MIRARPKDAARIAAFLNRAPHLAMFPLANLSAQGMDGDHPYSMRFWIGCEGDAITDVLGLSGGGAVMPALRADGAMAVQVLSGQSIGAIIGPAEQCRAIEAALGMQGAQKLLDVDEPQYLLDLADLVIPGGTGALCPIAQAPEAVIRGWMADYHANTLNTPSGRLAAEVDRWFAQVCAADTHVVLMDGDVPLAMTGFNAQLPQIVQIGGVYTPPPLRGRGGARRAVALHLAQARAAGVTRATLFSSSPAASRSYQAIGFRQVGKWSLILLQDALEVP